MRVEPYEVDSYVHVIKRGARGMPIVRDEADKKRFVKLLYYLNDEFKLDQWERAIDALEPFERPPEWPERSPYVAVIGWVLMPNHFHLLLKVKKKNGVSKFMQRLCGSMSAHFNAKYKEKGSLFQGAYKSCTIVNDLYLRQVLPYVMVKNVFELYPGGYKSAIEKFEDAWQWGVTKFAYSSLPIYGADNSSPIVEGDIVAELFPSASDFKKHAKSVIYGRQESLDIVRTLALDTVEV